MLPPAQTMTLAQSLRRLQMLQVLGALPSVLNIESVF